MHDRQFLSQFHRKMGKVNKRKISRGGKLINNVVANALQPMQNTGVISVLQSNSNLTNVTSTHLHNTSTTNSSSNLQPNLSSSLPNSNLSNASTNQQQQMIALQPQQTSLNLQAAANQSNQLIATNLNQIQQQQRQQASNSSIHALNQIQQQQQQSNPSNPLLDLQQMNSIQCNELQTASMISNGQFSNLNQNLNLQNTSMNNDLNNIQPQHNIKCARLDTTNQDLKWDLKPNLIKLESDLNSSNSQNSNSSNNHSHNSNSSIDSTANCFLKNNCDLNAKLTGGYQTRSRNGKYELKILKQPEEQHR